jgi:hypothetical protein
MFENYKCKQSHWVIPERSTKEWWWQKVSFPLLSMKGNRKMFSHTFIEVMCYAGQDIFVVASAHSRLAYYILFNKYKTFSVLIYSYINTSRNWENEKECGNTTPEERSIFTQFRVFPISTFYNIAQRNIKEEIFRRFPVDIELYQHGS